MGKVKRSLALVFAVGACALLPGIAQASGASYFCNQDPSAHYYGAYQDCWGGNARVINAVYSYGYGVSVCASYATYYGEPFTTSHQYSCDVGGFQGIILQSQTILRYPENHMQGVAGYGLGYYGWN